jgi:inner membrane protein
MDNLTHTFVGAALAEAGLKRRTALGAATLMIGANFPDIDVAGLAFPDSINIRRGATHGFLALAILPFVLAWLMMAYDKHVRRRRDAAAEPADFRQLTILSAVAIATHPTLDFMNIYGMRWLMPFVNKWFYADGLFIVDIWILAALVIGVVWARKASNTRPARVALAALAAYATSMLLITGIGRTRVAGEHPGRRFMAAPTMLVPWHRNIVLEDAGVYRFGRWSLFGGLVLSPSSVAIGDSDPAVSLARQVPEAQGFLRWARFPFYRVERQTGQTVVRIADVRYSGESGRGWASIEVRLP